MRTISVCVISHGYAQICVSMYLCLNDCISEPLCDYNQHLELSGSLYVCVCVYVHNCRTIIKNSVPLYETKKLLTVR